VPENGLSDFVEKYH